MFNPKFMGELFWKLDQLPVGNYKKRRGKNPLKLMKKVERGMTIF